MTKIFLNVIKNLICLNSILSTNKFPKLKFDIQKFQKQNNFDQ